MSEPTTLSAYVERAADGLEGVRREAVGGSVTWSRGGRPFAVLEGEVIELRLDPAVAHAATRTPDTTPSPRGAEWVRFAPGQLDGNAIDRLDAWFAHASRRASD